MNELEQDLRNALRRQNPPDGFTERVLARTRPHASPNPSRWIGLAVAAGLLLAAGNFEYRQYEGRKAKRELLLALSITGSKLNIVQQKLIDLNKRTTHD